MGDSKRRKETMGDKYGQEANIYPWLPLKKSQAERFMTITTRSAWAGIGLLILLWITVRFVGPTFGWWQVN